MEDILSIQSSSLPDDVRCVAFDGREALLTPYQFNVFVVSSAGDQFDMAAAIGATATLSVTRGGGTEPLQFHGVFAAVKLLQQEGPLGVYRLVLVPKLWRLRHSRHSRIHTDTSVPDAIKATLELAGLTSDDFRFQLTGSYDPEEHIAQYQESDLDFIHRWMEFEGMYYFFEQTGDHEVMVITDHKSSHEALDAAAIRYQPGAEGDVMAKATFWKLSRTLRARPASVRVADYNYSNPGLDVSADAEVSPTGTGEVVVHGARFFDPGRAAHIATVRAEELIARQETVRMEGSPMYQRAGYLTEVEQHPVAAVNRKYLITAANHYAIADDLSDALAEIVKPPFPGWVYRTQLEAMADDVQFRPARVTRWPTVWGFEAGTVCGKTASEYAQIDDQGRYKVKFRFDESDLTDGAASTNVRMQQPHGGGVEGFHFPLRKGTEVMFTFQDGDPDRPVIAAVLPNAHTPAPVVAGNYSANIIQTGGRNRIEMEDMDGSQRVTIFSPVENSFLRMGAPNDECNLFLHTEGKGCINVERMCKWETGNDKTEIVHQNLTENFKGPLTTENEEGKTTEHYKNTKRETVGAALTETYKKKTDVTVTNLENEDYGSHSTHVEGVREEDVRSTVTETYTGPLTSHVTGDVSDTYQSGYTCTVTGDENHMVTGMLAEDFGDYEQVTKDWIQNCTAAFVKLSLSNSFELFVGLKNENLIGGKIETLVGVKLEAITMVDVNGLAVEFKTGPEEKKAVGAAFKDYGVHVKTVAAAVLEAYASGYASNAPVHLMF